MEMIKRPRRLRGSMTLRKMVRETRMDKASLMYPMFVMDGENKVEEIPSMEGQYRYTVDRMEECLQELLDAGVTSVMLFGIPEAKDEVGSQAYDDNGIVQRALRYAKEHFPQMYLVTDVCMCEYTSHGHCGVLCDHDVDNDKTLELLAKTAVSHAKAGAQMVAPSDMMDGRVAAIREALDEAGFANVPIMSNMRLHFTVHSVMQLVLHLHLETARLIRWTSTTAGRESGKQCWMKKKALILSW